MNKNKESGYKEALKEIFHDKKILVFAVEDINTNNIRTLNPENTIGLFFYSTINSQESLVQLAMLLAKEPELKKALEEIIEMSNTILNTEELREALTHVISKTK